MHAGMCAHLSEELGAAGSFGVGVELQEGAQILQGVLLEGHVGAAGLGLAHDALNLVTVDEAGQVRIGHLPSGQLVALLLLAGLLCCACAFSSHRTSVLVTRSPAANIFTSSLLLELSHNASSDK